MTVAPATDWLMVPLPPALRVTLVEPVNAAPRLMFPLLTAGAVVVVLRLIVAALIADETVIDPVVGELPAAPLALTSNVPQVPVTADESVSVLSEMYCKLRLPEPLVDNVGVNAELVPFSTISA